MAIKRKKIREGVELGTKGKPAGKEFGHRISKFLGPMAFLNVIFIFAIWSKVLKAVLIQSPIIKLLGSILSFVAILIGYVLSFLWWALTGNSFFEIINEYWPWGSDYMKVFLGLLPLWAIIGKVILGIIDKFFLTKVEKKILAIIMATPLIIFPLYLCDISLKSIWEEIIWISFYWLS